ncbi:hypothetical protein ACH5RR_028707 [Cinchona calisaya]|uniref:J domain-containing protein n=1 Tax=Cinchona calisaya TaxID=153742 RepID=A0ABD2YRR8_9GENT
MGLVDYYKILQVDEKVTNDDLFKAFAKLHKNWDPEKNPHNSKEAVSNLKLICEAFEVLSDPHKRAVYDHENGEVALEDWVLLADANNLSTGGPTSFSLNRWSLSVDDINSGFVENPIYSPSPDGGSGWSADGINSEIVGNLVYSASHEGGLSANDINPGFVANSVPPASPDGGLNADDINSGKSGPLIWICRKSGPLRNSINSGFFGDPILSASPGDVANPVPFPSPDGGLSADNINSGFAANSIPLHHLMEVSQGGVTNPVASPSPDGSLSTDDINSGFVRDPIPDGGLSADDMNSRFVANPILYPSLDGGLSADDINSGFVANPIPSPSPDGGCPLCIRDGGLSDINSRFVGNLIPSALPDGGLSADDINSGFVGNLIPSASPNDINSRFVGDPIPSSSPVGGLSADDINFGSIGNPVPSASLDAGWRADDINSGSVGNPIASASQVGGASGPSGSMCQTAPRKTPPVERKLCCTLEDLYKGTTKRMKVFRQVARPVNGMTVVAEIFRIDVKPGWKKGTRITFPDEGYEAPGVLPADLVFIIDEKPHPVFTRDGNDLVVTQKISLAEASRGYTVHLTTLDGRSLTIPVNNVIHPTYEKVVRREGMPLSRDPSKKGNLRIKFDFDTNSPAM